MACMKRGAVDRISSETRGVGDCLWMHGHLIFFSLSSFTTTRLCTVYENYQKNMSFHIFIFKTKIILFLTGSFTFGHFVPIFGWQKMVGQILYTVLYDF